MVIFAVRGLIRKNLAISKRLTSVPRRQFSDKYDSGKKRRSFETAVLSIGIVGSIAAGGIILARKNEQFRDTLRTILPFGDKIVEFTSSDINTIFGRTVGTDDEDNLSAEYYSMFKGAIDRMKKGFNEKMDGLLSKKSDQVLIEKGADSPKSIPIDLAASSEPYKLEPQKTNENLDGCEYDPAKIATLENRLSSQVKEAIDTYQEGIRVLKIYSEDIEKIVDSATDFNDDNLWFDLKQATIRRNELLDKAERLLNDACQTRSDLNVIFTDSRINIDDDLKKQVKRKMNHLFEDLDMARTQFDVQKERASVTQKFWENVKKARDKFCNELETLFPDIDFSKPSIHFEDTDALDLFLLYVQTQFMLLEKRYSHLETIGQNTINNIMGTDNLEEKQTKTIKYLAEKKYQVLKTQLDNDFQKKSIELRINADRDLRKQLKIQQQVAIDHVSESLDEQRADLEDRFSDELNKALNQERERYHIRLAEMVGRLVTIETSLKKRTVADRHAKKAQLFWSACENLYSSIGMTNSMYGPRKRTHLINQELDLVAKTAGDSDDFVSTIIDSIPPSVINGGVYTEEGLRDRFVKVEAVVRRLALVPENGGSLYVYFMSYMQSLFIKKSVAEIPEKELLNELVNFNDFDTFDIIARARYWMDRGDFPLVLRYMNLLNGAPRKISQDWIDELRKFVEMKLAAKALMTHAIANGLTNLELLS